MDGWILDAPYIALTSNENQFMMTSRITSHLKGTAEVFGFQLANDTNVLETPTTIVAKGSYICLCIVQHTYILHMVLIDSEDFFVWIFFNASHSFLMASALISYRIFPRFDHRGHPGGQFHGNSIKSRNDWKLTQTPNLLRFSLRSPQKRLFNNRATIFSVLSLALTWGWAMMLLVDTNAYLMLSILHL